MPEMALLGWFHTIAGVAAVLSGLYTIFKYKVISLEEFTGKLYLFITLIVAGSALGIYNQGGFGLAHILAVLALIAPLGIATQILWLKNVQLTHGLVFEIVNYTT